MGLFVEDSFKLLTASEANKPVRALQTFNCVSHGNIFANVTCALSVRRLRTAFALPIRQQFCELLWVGHGQFAGEIFTNVSDWFAINYRHRANRRVFFADVL